MVESVFPGYTTTNWPCLKALEETDYFQTSGFLLLAYLGFCKIN